MVLTCFCFTFSHHGGSPLESVGSITGKVVVTATDEVYQDTKHKMKLADEEMKKARYLKISLDITVSSFPRLSFIFVDILWAHFFWDA